MVNSGDNPIEIDLRYSVSIFFFNLLRVKKNYFKLLFQRYQNMTPHPHICYKNERGQTLCEVYTKYSKPIKLDINLKTLVPKEGEEVQTCKYALGPDFHCRITPTVERNLTRGSGTSCRPIVKCNIHEPYNSTDSMLRVTECGYNNISFWLYLFIRSFADIFPTAAVALLNAAVVIATRETSTGRGDVGKQLAAGALGFAIFAPICGAVGGPLISLILFTVLLVIGALILLFDR